MTRDQLLTPWRKWDIVFLALLPTVFLAGVVGVLFGGPFDNLIVTGWLIPVWLAARAVVPEGPRKT